MSLGRGWAAALALAAAGCSQPARELAAGPGGPEAAHALVEALALRFGVVRREPAFDALRSKLARGALIPSRAFEDTSAWPRRGETWRAVDLAGDRADGAYRIGVRPSAPEPREAGQYRGEFRLEKLASGRFEWTVREELAVGAVGPSRLAAAFDALLLAAEATDEAHARAAIHGAFPRASAKLGELLRLERLALGRDAHGATGIDLAVRIAPDGVRPKAPRFAAFVDKYLGPIRARATAADATGAEWWAFAAERHLWSLRLRLKGGSLVPLAGEATRRIPGRLSVGGDYATKMGAFRIAVRALTAEVALTRTPAEKGFVARFQRRPDWDLPFLVEPLLGSPLHYPFEGPGSEAGWAARETATGTSLVRHYRARLAENWILRWLGGLTNRAVSDFRAGAEDEAERYYAECLDAIRDDLMALLRENRPPGGGQPKQSTWPSVVPTTRRPPARAGEAVTAEPVSNSPSFVPLARSST